MKVRCPHCHNPIELLQESAALDSDIECPSCGSSFNLLRETDTASYEPAKHNNVAHFELIEKLGTGAFGTVYKARDSKLDRVVALKIPRKSQLDEEETEKFLREARASAQLRHPNIVSVHEVGRDGPTVYIVADLVEGLTLSDWLTGQRLTPREAVELCVKLADAVHHAHECGVIHRDLKPSNVMLNAAGEPFVMDFGLAKREAGEITMTVDGQIIGTPAYMAPEQARGESHHVDRRSDVYSLGVLLFELLTGERPFRGNARMLLYQVIHDEPPSPRRLNAAIPKDLETICLKCLEKDRSKRFATAHDLANELRRFLHGEPILSRPVSRAERLWRWSKRNPVVATLSASVSALILFLLVAGPIVYFREVQLRKDAQTAEADAKQAGEAADKAKDAAIRTREVLQQRLYFSDMNLAGQAAEEPNFLRVRQLLQQHLPDNEAPDLRGFEWFYLWRIAHNHYFSLKASGLPYFTDHSNRLHALNQWGYLTVDLTKNPPDKESLKHTVPLKGVPLAVSRDGSLVVTVNDQFEVLVWDTSSCQLRHALKGHQGMLWAAAFSPDGTRLITASRDRSARVWDVRKGTALATFDSTHQVSALAHSPVDDRWIAVENRQLVIHRGDQSVVGQLQKSHNEEISAISFTNDGKLVAAASNVGTVEMYDLDAQHAIRKWQHGDNVKALAFSPDSSLLASSAIDGLVKLWDTGNGKNVAAYPLTAGAFQRITFSADGTYLVGSAHSGDGPETTVWNIKDPKSRTTVPLQGKGEYSHIALQPDGTLVAVYPTGISLVDTQEMKLTRQIQFPGFATAIAVSSDGQFVATANSESRVEVWNVNSGEIIGKIVNSSSTSRIDVLDFSQDGHQLAILSTDKKIASLWNIPTGTRLWEASPGAGALKAVTFSKSGDRLFVSETGTSQGIHILDARSGQSLGRLKCRGDVLCLAESTDGAWLAAGTGGGQIMIWDLATETLHREMTGHRVSLTTVAFFPDGKTIASGGHDKTIKLWDVSSGTELLTLHGHSSRIHGLAISNDKSFIASTSDSQTAVIWRAAVGVP